MTKQPRPRPPLDRGKLDELALRYVARFATSRAKLKTYLQRKLRERGWEGTGEPPVSEIAERLAELGYVDDGAFALAKGRSLGARGYGPRRLAGALSAAGIGEEDSEPAMTVARDNEAEAALRFAQRRRIGPFADQPADPKTREKWLAAMVRAGHGFGLSRRLVDCAPGAIPDESELGG